MKKGVVVILAALVILNIVYASWNIESQEVGISLDIKGGFEIYSKGSNPSIRYITANLTFFPKEDYRQKINNIISTPQADSDETSFLFRWDEPSFGWKEFDVNSNIKIKNVRKKIDKKVAFPLKNLPSEITPYIKPSPTIDSGNRDIIRLANSLVGGEDDLFAAVNNLASWTKDNIHYNLSTVTSSVSKSASWVLENRQGVCDELTNLFIAMCRSLGIPAKFVSGIAYTDSELFSDPWGPHGWAEVYFPGYGWIEYDVTYRQFGFIDPTHIKLKESKDATESSTTFNWMGRNVEIKTKETEFETSLISHNGKIEKTIDMEIWPEKDEMGPNSYNLINVKVSNLKDYYISEELQLLKTKETTLEESSIKNIFLGPHEEKEIYWIIKNSELDPGYIYTFPIAVIDSLNNTIQSSFNAGYNGPVHTIDEINSIIENRFEESKKAYSGEIDLECKAEKEEAYSYEGNKIICSVENNGNVFFESMSVCLKDKCERIELGISQTKEINFDIIDTLPGKKDSEIIVKGEDAVKTSNVQYVVLDKPSVILENITYPKEVRYDDNFEVDFLMKKDSFSNPYDMQIELKHDGYDKEWGLEEMDQNRRFTVQMRGKELDEGNNDILISVDFQDKNGNNYKEEKKINIQLIGLSFGQKIMVFFNSIFRKVLTKQGLITIVAIAGIIFLITMFLILRK